MTLLRIIISTAACCRCRRNTVLNYMIPSLMSLDDVQVNPSFFCDREVGPKLIDPMDYYMVALIRQQVDHKLQLQNQQRHMLCGTNTYVSEVRKLFGNHMIHIHADRFHTLSLWKILLRTSYYACKHTGLT